MEVGVTNGTLKMQIDKTKSNNSVCIFFLNSSVTCVTQITPM